MVAAKPDAGRGVGRRPNRLIHETSRYLRQHADNPVDWYPWGPEALERARREDKPIFLSIGYSACHWCHVMAAESFADEGIAAILNEHFVNIKVDREERPDLDLIYQRAAQVTGVPGGWPLSVFLLPDQRPFWVGTYFPPEDRYGRPAFRRVLQGVLQAFRQRRREVEAVADRIVAALRLVEEPRDPAVPQSGSHGRADPASVVLLPGESSPLPSLAAAAERLLADFDWDNGGFGGQPKFPNASALELLWRSALRLGREPERRAVLLTLRRMARGGIYDQIGGGFHRYAVDSRWRVPHFEKMLYDNALLPPLYLAAYRATGDEELARVARETLDYVLRELAAPEGGFYASQDADSEGQEGKYFVWRPEELSAVLGKEEAQVAARWFGVTPEGNFDRGASVLHVAVELDTLAQELGLSPDAARARLETIRRRLFAARQQRVPPATDTKVITAWNGMMIAALADAGWVLGEAGYLHAAERAASFLLEALRDASGSLLHVYAEGRGAIPAYLDDYAFLIHGLLRLHEATLAERWIVSAVALAEQMIELFWDEEAGCFYYTAAGGEALVHRPRDLYDTATPSATAAALGALVRIAPFAPRLPAADCVERVVRRYASEMARNPLAWAATILAADEHQEGPVEVTLVARDASDATLWEWHRRLGQLAVSGLLVTRVPLDLTTLPPSMAEATVWAGRQPQDSQATVYVCQNFRCSPPIREWADLKRRLTGA